MFTSSDPKFFSAADNIFAKAGRNDLVNALLSASAILRNNTPQQFWLHDQMGNPEP